MLTYFHFLAVAFNSEGCPEFGMRVGNLDELNLFGSQVIYSCHANIHSFGCHVQCLVFDRVYFHIVCCVVLKINAKPISQLFSHWIDESMIVKAVNYVSVCRASVVARFRAIHRDVY